MGNEGEFSSVVHSLNRDPRPTVTMEEALRRLRKQGAIEKLAKGIDIKLVSDHPIVFITDSRRVTKGTCEACHNHNAVKFMANTKYMPAVNGELFIYVCPDCRVMKPGGKHYIYMRKRWIKAEEERRRKEYLASLCPCGCGRVKKQKWAGQRCKTRHDTLDAIARGVGPTIGELTIQLNHIKKCIALHEARERTINKTQNI